jgi:hypothetical protein
MNYYITRHDDCANLDFVDATGLFQALARMGAFDDHHAFNRLSLSVERALWQGSASSDADAILREVEEMLAKLGVVPFNKNSPPRAM